MLKFGWISSTMSLPVLISRFLSSLVFPYHNLPKTPVSAVVTCDQFPPLRCLPPLYAVVWLLKLFLTLSVRF
jgi:hypothetical protein